MRIKELIKLGQIFFLIGFFFLFLYSPLSWGADDFEGSEPMMPWWGVDGHVQSSEVIIKLEKVIPKNIENSSSIDTDEGAISFSNDSASYEDLEDPFAGDSKDIPILKDPLEGYNRWMFDVNETIYTNMMEPVARGYRNTVHENLRIGIKNLFSNAMAPVRLISSLLQLDFAKSGRIIARTLINTTFGFVGFADVAGEEYNIDAVNEDIGQALGSYGVPTGPYLVLPFFGPSTARDVVGRAVGTFMSPTFYFGPSTGVSMGITAEETINDVSFIIDDKKQLEDSALDEYESVRDFYHQYRHGLVNK
jgi:phospholipid-binding lipoprotein MlaA